MTTAPFHARPHSARAPISRRWPGLVLVSLLLHVVIINWANGNLKLPAMRDQDHAVMTAELRPAPIVHELPPAPKPRPVVQRKKPRPASRPAPVAAAVPSRLVETSPPAPVMPDLAASGDSTVAPSAEPPPVVEIAPPEPPAVTNAVAKEPAAVHYKFNHPPSAELKYDVQALREGQTVYGHGKLGWRAEGDRYTATGEAGVLFFTVLNFKSEGAIDESGVAPVLYSEKRFRKSPTNTHFHRERNIISFSASEASYPRKGGEQDRASIIWQLVGIGRGDSEKFLPGAEIDIFVAGVRDAEIWRIHVIGEEEIPVGSGKTRAWHVARAPRPGSYDQKLDIWLAPQQEWYPVKLRYTETNGDYLDMLLSNVNFTPAQ